MAQQDMVLSHSYGGFNYLALCVQNSRTSWGLDMVGP